MDFYQNYGIGSGAGTTIFETTLPTESYIYGGMLVTSSYGDTDGDKDIRTCVFYSPTNIFRSSDLIYDYNIFIHENKLLYTPSDDKMLVEVDLNKTFN